MDMTRVKGAATLSDVARLAGTSKGTASRALNGRHWVAPATRDAVLQAAKELGFRADPTAQSLARGRQSTLVGLFAHSLDLGVGTLKLQLLQNALNEKGYDAPIHACGSVQTQEQALINLCRQRPAAIICWTHNLQKSALLQLQKYLVSGGIVTCYDSQIELEGKNVDYVVFDRDDNTYQAVRHLLELGHRRIGLFSGGARHSEERLHGFKRALDEFGVAVKPELLFVSERQHPAEVLLNEQVGQRFGNAFASLQERPSAICITDDHVSAGFIAAVQRRGLRVPQDISVVSQDDLPIAAYACSVALTTVSQPIQDIARECVRFVTSRLEDEYSGTPRQSTLRGRLVLRESAAQMKVSIMRS